MDGDWPLKQTSPGTTTEEIQASQEANGSTWTLVEYRPGRYARVAPDGAVLGRASEAEVRAWFGAQSKQPPRSTGRSQESTPAPESGQTTKQEGLQAWFAAQRQERQVTQSQSSDAHSESTTQETAKPGIRDWLAAQKGDARTGTSALHSDPPAVSAGRLPGGFRSLNSIPAGDRDVSVEQPDATPLAERPRAGVELNEEVQVGGIGPDPDRPQVELPPSKVSGCDPEPGELEPAPAALPEPDLCEPELSPKGTWLLASEPKAAVEPAHDSLELEVVQLGFMPAVVGEDTDLHPEGRMIPAGEAVLNLEDPPPAGEREPALVDPSPARKKEPIVEELSPVPERESTIAEPPPPAVKLPTRGSGSDEPNLTPTLELGDLEPARPAMEPKESPEVEITDLEIELPASESMSVETETGKTDEDLGTDSGVDWLDPGTLRSGARDLDQALASAPSMAGGANAGGAGVGGIPVRAAQDLDGSPPEPIASDGHDRWLWVDPRQERGYDVGAFDLAAFLSRAARLFQSKDWTGGRKPARLAAHPAEVANGLKAMAESLGFEVVSDPRVTAGTYRLGLATDEE